MKKLSNTRAELKKSIAYTKASTYFYIFLDQPTCYILKILYTNYMHNYVFIFNIEWDSLYLRKSILPMTLLNTNVTQVT